MLDFVLIANPESRRVQHFQAALKKYHAPPAQLLTYTELLNHPDSGDLLNNPNAWIRFEAPERNFTVVRDFIVAGASHNGSHPKLTAAEAAILADDVGRIYYPRQWYLGWKRCLEEWEREIQGHCLNAIADIITMFDKLRCQKILLDSGIPVPPILSPAQTIESVEQLRDRMDQLNYEQVFVKLAHGSSASGVVAFERRYGIEQATTSVERVRARGGPKFYNSRKIRQYRRSEDIEDILGFVIAEGAQIEAWLPKARWQGREFDVRIVVIGGKARHGVVRVGKSPMTNLHLGSDRLPIEQLRAKISEENWAAMMATCERAARCFPNSLYCGIDLLISPNFRDHYILEMNAFGDLLQNIFWQGKNTYELELEMLWEQQQISPPAFLLP